MNSLFELPPEPEPTPEPAPKPLLKLVPAHGELEVAAQAGEIVLSDDAAKDVAMVLIARLKDIEKDLNTERRTKTDPLNEEIDKLTKPYTERIAKAKAARTMLETKLFQYVQEKEKERQRLQREENERVRLIQVKNDEAAKKLRDEADAKRAEGNELEAVKLEGKAQRAELVSENAVPTLVQQPQAKTTPLFDGTKTTIRTTKDFAYENGLPRGGAYSRTDSRFKDIPDEHFFIDETVIGKLVRAGLKIPGILIVEKPVTANRK